MNNALEKRLIEALKNLAAPAMSLLRTSTSHDDAPP